MKNLRKERLGYEYVNSLGHPCKVTAYKSNKEVVVHDEVTDKFHECRWCDLQNVRCTAVYDATAARNRFKEELDKVSAINTVTEAEKPANGANSEVIRKVKESENWCFSDEVTSCSDDYDEDGNSRGCAASVIVVGMLLAIALLVLGILLW